MNDTKEKTEIAEEFSSDTTIVAINVPYEQGEDIQQKMTNMIRRDLAVNIMVKRVKRMPVPAYQTGQQNRTRPKRGIVKIQLHSVQDKIAILREKQKLKNSRDYSYVYLRSSKSHAEHLMELNFKTILDMLPQGTDYRMTGNGKLVKKDGEQRTTDPNRQEPPQGAPEGATIDAHL